LGQAGQECWSGTSTIILILKVKTTTPNRRLSIIARASKAVEKADDQSGARALGLLTPKSKLSGKFVDSANAVRKFGKGGIGEELSAEPDESKGSQDAVFTNTAGIGDKGKLKQGSVDGSTTHGIGDGTGQSAEGATNAAES
jgi:hypothetical protein